MVAFLAESDPAAAAETFELIVEAVAVLQDHPHIGRPAEQGLRELIISRGRSGYIALYDVEEINDVVRIMAIRHQREAGFSIETEPTS